MTQPRSPDDPRNSRDPQSVGIRLVRRSDPAITDVTFDPVLPGPDSNAGLSARATSSTGHLRRLDRPAMAPRRERESLALAIMVDELSRDPGNLLQRLVEVLTGVCGVATAAVAMTDGNPLRWDAAAGPMADSPRWTTFHRAGASRRDAEHKPRSGAADRLASPPHSAPPIVDAQAIPLRHDGEMVGVLWIANPDDGGALSAEDDHVVHVLAQLATSAWTIWARGDAARRASDRKSEFLALVSHELRNPLNAIAAAAALFRYRAPGSDDGAGAAGIVARQCQFMSRLVADLSDTARLDHGKLDLQVASIDARAMVVEALASRRQQIEQRGHTLALDIGEEPLTIDADPVRLVQMLSNLIDNAVKYTARGGRIGVSLRRTAGDLRLAVEDTGVGLPADQLAEIFEPFAQLERSKRSRGGGLGLGLQLARSLAELHGGTLHATSRGLGHGSSFVITLPAAGAPRPIDAVGG
jgi:signal transduction histidine kinase